MRLSTFLNYGGNCADALRYYEEHLGGKIISMMTHGERPGAADVPEHWKHAVLYARLELGGTEISASDVPPEQFQPMRSAYLSVSVDSNEEAERICGILQIPLHLHGASDPTRW